MLSYLVLLLSSLVVPALHICLTDRAIEHSRMSTGFLPAQFLLWRWLGQLAWLFPVAVLVAFALSLRQQQSTRASPPWGLFAAQFLFTTFYGVYCAFLLSHLLLEQVT